MNNSMISPSVTDLLENIHDRYSLVILSSKRARQIIEGSAPKITMNSNKPLTIAINEIDRNAVEYEVIEEGIE